MSKTMNAEQKAKLIMDFELYGAVVNTDNLRLEPAYHDQGTSLAQARLRLTVMLNKLQNQALRDLERVARARVQMDLLIDEVAR